VHPRGGYLRRSEASGRFLLSALAGGVPNVTRFPRPDATRFPSRPRELLLRCRASLVQRRDSGAVTDAELAALKAKLIHG